MPLSKDGFNGLLEIAFLIRRTVILCDYSGIAKIDHAGGRGSGFETTAFLGNQELIIYTLGCRASHTVFYIDDAVTSQVWAPRQSPDRGIYQGQFGSSATGANVRPDGDLGYSKSLDKR